MSTGRPRRSPRVTASPSSVTPESGGAVSRVVTGRVDSVTVAEETTAPSVSLPQPAIADIASRASNATAHDRIRPL